MKKELTCEEMKVMEPLTRIELVTSSLTKEEKVNNLRIDLLKTKGLLFSD